MIYQFGECTLDTKLYTLQRSGQTFRLRPKVFRTCLYLLEHRERVVSRDELCRQVWPGQFVSQTTLEGVIRLVRQALGDSGRTQGMIRTFHGRGYRFVANVEERPPLCSDGEPARAATFDMAPAEAVPAAGAGVPTGTVAGHESEAAQSRLQSEERRPDALGANGSGADSRGPFLPGKQQGMYAREGGWWLFRIALALGLVTLVVLGGWALSQGVLVQGTVSLDKARIAVLPFVDLSAEANQRSFVDGVTGDLIAELARIEGLTVIARTSVMKYKGTTKDVATIGRELRVGTVLEGSVRRQENRARISVQLIDVVSQGHVWSEEYERELPEILGIERDIAAHVAQRLQVQPTASTVSDCLPTEAQSTTVVEKIGLGK